MIEEAIAQLKKEEQTVRRATSLAGLKMDELKTANGNFIRQVYEYQRVMRERIKELEQQIGELKVELARKETPNTHN